MLHLIGRNKVIHNKNNFLDDIGKGFIGGLGAFNPNFDGNALAWYDGNAGLTNLQWNDQGAGGHDIIFSNLPTIVANATPLRDAVRFDGINQRGVVVTPVMNQPFTIYLVINTVSWILGKYIYDDGVVILRKTMRQQISAPNIRVNAGTPIESNPSLAIGTYGVYTAVFNVVSSELRTNLNVSVAGNLGANNGAGITLASTKSATQFSNVEFGYIIIRTGADSTAIQNRIINGLKAVCGLTF